MSELKSQLSHANSPLISMFCDEPTSGLDSRTAAGVMESLKANNMATGMTLLVTIHQPSVDIYRLFDGLVLLHRGELCYFGEGGDAPCAFLHEQVRGCASGISSMSSLRSRAAHAQGFPYRPGFSVTEFLLDTIGGGSLDGGGTSVVTIGGHPEAVQPHDFAAAYAQSPLCAMQRNMVESGNQVQLEMHALTSRYILLHSSCTLSVDCWRACLSLASLTRPAFVHPAAMQISTQTPCWERSFSCFGTAVLPATPARSSSSLELCSSPPSAHCSRAFSTTL